MKSQRLREAATARPAGPGLPALLAARARASSAAPAMRHKLHGIWHVTTWQDQAKAVEAMASALAARGIGPDSLVAVVGDNRPDLYQAALAALLLGAAVVPSAPAPGPGEDWRIRLAGTDLVIAESAAVAASLPVRALLLSDLAQGGGTEGDLALLERRAATLAGDRPALHLFTAAAHGEPVRVVLSHDELVAAGERLAAGLGADAGWQAMACMPPCTYADAQLVFGLHLVAGVTVNCPEGPSTFLSDLREVAPHVLVATPRLFEQIDLDIQRRLARSGPMRRLARGLGDVFHGAPLRNALGLSRCRAAVVTGDVVAPGTAGRLKALGLPLIDGYGLTEAAGIVALDGRWIGGVEGRVREGRLELRLEDGREIATGDRARLTGDGRLELTGREAEPDIHGAALEARLRDHPEVDRVAVQRRADGRLDALVAIDHESVGRFAESKGIAFSGPAALARHPEVKALIAERMTASGAPFGDIRIVDHLAAGGPAVSLDGRLRRDRLWRRLAVVDDDFPGLFETTGEAPRTIGEPVLAVSGVSLAFGGIKALTDVSLDVRRGEILSIIGPNGAGKTSLLNVLNGVYHPQSGRIVCNGVERRRMRASLAPRQGIGRTFQNVALFKGMNVLDNVMVGRTTRFRGSLLGKALRLPSTLREEVAQRAEVERIIAFLDLEAVRKTVVGSLPYGVQKRVELARALAAEPAIMLLDEPMAGMTYEEKQDMCRFIRAANRELGTTIILIEHDIGVVMGMSDRVIVLNYGVKIADGTPDEVRANADVVAAYLGPSANVAAV